MASGASAERAGATVIAAPRRRPPPLTPVLLAGFALRPLPPALLRPVLDAAVTALRRRHPEVVERLTHLGEASFLIDPVDLPFVFILRLGTGAWALTAASRAPAPAADATIRGPLLALVDLLEGRVDGDAMFFARDLAIEGDTEAVVALRNAVDDAEIDLVGDVLALFGPLGRPARRLLGAGARVFARAAEDLDTLGAAVIAPALRRSDRLAAELSGLEERLDAARRRGDRVRARRR